MSWRVNKLVLVFGLLAMSGIAQFVFSLALAIDQYGDEDGYSITENFLSDLGRTRTVDGLNNVAASAIFNRSVVILSLSLVPFFCALTTVLHKHRASVPSFGVVSSLGLVGIGLTPYDRYFVAHNVALGLWLGPMLVMVLGFYRSFRSEGAASRKLAGVTVLLLLATIGYALVNHHSGHVVFQKIVAVLAVIWFLLVFVSVSVSTIQSVSPRQLLAERQAIRYMEVIRRGPRRQRKPEEPWSR